MSIVALDAPETCVAALREALTRRMATPGSYSAVVEPGARVGAPIPRLTLTHGDAAKRRDLVFPIVGGRRPGLATMVQTGAARAWRYEGLRWGSFAVRLLEACALIEAEVEPRPERFEARLVEIHELHFAALWMYSPTADFFVSLLDGTPKGSARLDVREDLEVELLARA